jgi:hypothetical protein
LRRVGWAAHLAGLDRTELQEWIEMPDEEEPDLEILCEAFDWMIQDAQYTTVQEVVSQAALFKANRKDANVEPQKPFDSWMDITTIQRYTQVWKQALCYVFQAEDKDIEKRLAYKLQGRQQIAWLYAPPAGRPTGLRTGHHPPAPPKKPRLRSLSTALTIPTSTTKVADLDEA